MKLYKRGKYYYFRPVINGKQIWHNTEETEYLKAKIHMENFLADKNKSKKKTPEGKYNIDTLLWTDFCKLYMDWANSVKKAPESDTLVITQINRILVIKYLKELDEPKIRQYINYRKEFDKVKDSTCNRQLHVMKSMWTFAIEHLGIDVKSPAKLVKDKPVAREVKKIFFTIEQKNKILKEANPLYMKILCWLMFSFALRLKEAVLVEWSDINFKTNRILINPQKTENKNPNATSLIMPTDFVNFIKTVPHKGKYVIGKEFVTRRQRNDLNHLVTKQFKRIVGIGTSHSCRHTWISHAINNPNISERDIMKYARITDPKTLDSYAHYKIEREYTIANAVYQEIDKTKITKEEIDRKIKELEELKKSLSSPNIVQDRG